MEYLCYKRFLTADNHIPGFSREQSFTNLIIVKVKLEAGENGDAFIHISRYYSDIVESNPRCCKMGALHF
jgi:hypothetical protein